MALDMISSPDMQGARTESDLVLSLKPAGSGIGDRVGKDLSHAHIQLELSNLGPYTNTQVMFFIFILDTFNKCYS